MSRRKAFGSQSLGRTHIRKTHFICTLTIINVVQAFPPTLQNYYLVSHRHRGITTSSTLKRTGSMMSNALLDSSCSAAGSKTDSAAFVAVKAILDRARS